MAPNPAAEHAAGFYIILWLSRFCGCLASGISQKSGTNALELRLWKTTGIDRMGRKGLDRDRRSAADLAGQHYPRRDGRPIKSP